MRNWFLVTAVCVPLFTQGVARGATMQGTSSSEHEPARDTEVGSKRAEPSGPAPSVIQSPSDAGLKPGDVSATPAPKESPKADRKRSHEFGYEFFSGRAAVVDGPIDDDYVLSPRDELVVTIWGEVDETMNLAVGDDGFVEIPKGGGRLRAGGEQLRAIRPSLIEAVSRMRAGRVVPSGSVQGSADALGPIDVRLSKIRPLLVHVVGEVNEQGAYLVSAAVANVVNLLNNAGGVKPTGSLRDVRIKRTDGRVDSVDLYGFFLRGDLDPKSIRLQPGDYVIVPLKKRSASVQGQVRRPMTYELLEKDGLKELVELAGGFVPDAYLKQAQLRRTELSTGEVLLDVDLEALYSKPEMNLELKDRDVLSIGSSVQVRRKVVTVKGEGVLRPGTYEWSAGMRLSDAIEKAKGLREHAYLERADLIRTEDDFTKRLISFRLDGLYSRQPGGRFGFEDHAELNHPLREMDEIVVQSTWGLSGKGKSVRLEGMVKEPGEHPLAQGMELQDLIFMHGGFQDPDFTKLAYQDMGHVVRKVAGGVGTRLIAFDLGVVLKGGPGSDLALEDGDVVRVYSAAELVSRQVVDIQGLVKKPGRYPFAESLTLEDLVVLAGGLLPEATRVEAVVARSLKDASVSEAKPAETMVIGLGRDFAQVSGEKHPLKPFDKVMIRHREGWEPSFVASVSGEVLRPGAYPLPRKDLRLSDLVGLAGGLKPEGYPQGATLQRRVATVRQSAGRLDGLEEVTIDLEGALRSPGSSADLGLQDGDALFVPVNSGVVTVSGAVGRPMSLQHRPGLTLGSYLEQCGGLLPKADRDRVSLKRPNGTTVMVGRDQDPEIMAGSVVQVPLQRQDERLQVVEVKGAVQKPALVQYTEDARLGYYLGVCGGLTSSADPEQVVVLTSDGQMVSRQGSQEFNPVIPPGATIDARRNPAWALFGIREGASEFECAQAVTNFVHQRSRVVPPGTTTLFSGFGDLALWVADQSKTVDGACGAYAFAVVEGCRQLGVPARLVNIGSRRFYDGLSSGDTHVMAEVYLQDGQGWTLFDPTFNIVYEDGQGRPLGIETLMENQAFDRTWWTRKLGPIQPGRALEDYYISLPELLFMASAAEYPALLDQGLPYRSTGLTVAEVAKRRYGDQGDGAPPSKSTNSGGSAE